MTPKERGLNPLGPRYLRVLTPRTSDGKTLVYDEKSQPIWDESHSPLTARKHLDRINDKLAKMYKMKITEVDETGEPEIEKLLKGAGKPAQEQKAAPVQMPDLKINEDKLQADQLKSENDTLKKQLAEMQKKLASKPIAGKAPVKSVPGKPAAPVKKEPAEELV